MPDTSVPKMKRIFDILLAIPVSLLLCCPMLIIAALVYLKMGSPIFFSQLRPGKDGNPFILYKFRTMIDLKDFSGNALPDARRLTRFGQLLRATSLDELPELWNVLKGEMSIVGPRPLLMQYMDLYTAKQARRHEMKPGLTGWAQVNGRNAVSWEERFEMDVWYVDHWSLPLDLKIMLMTFGRVLRREGISAQGKATMPEFLGTGDGGRKAEDGGLINEEGGLNYG